MLAGTRLDGVSLLPHLTGEVAQLDRDALFWQIKNTQAIQRHGSAPQPHGNTVARNGKWKLIALQDTPVALYDTDADPTEGNNLLGVAEHQSLIDSLTAELTAWLADPTAPTQVGLPGVTFGYLDLDGDVDATDWSLFQDGFGVDLSGLNLEGAYQQGDLNNDARNNYEDFVLFKSAYNALNGPSALDKLDTEVPEPSTGWLLGAGAIVWTCSPLRWCLPTRN